MVANQYTVAAMQSFQESKMVEDIAYLINNVSCSLPGISYKITDMDYTSYPDGENMVLAWRKYRVNTRETRGKYELGVK